MLARVTVYWPGESSPRASFNGARLHNGHCAVDPKRIPYGSKVLFPDATCVAVDTGPAVINRKAARLAGRTPAQRSAIVIDRYFDSRRQALDWADAHPHFMTVRILPPGSSTAASSQIAATSDAGSQHQHWWLRISNISPFRSSTEVAVVPPLADIHGKGLTNFLAPLIPN